MKTLFNTIFTLMIFITLISCGTVSDLRMKKTEPFQDNFDNEILFKSNWKNDSWKSPATYYLENNKLKITTRPHTKDRVKVSTKKKNFTTGTYTWRILVPEFKLFEQISIGAFLYHNEDDEFEFDFEIGSGQKKDREKINLKNDEAIVFCVSQFSPSNSSHFAVKMNAFSDFKMQLMDVHGFYLVKWFINNTLVKTLQTSVKSTIKFRVHNSLENLHFMGDTKTTTENYVLFDSFSYEINER